jgi:hypothetical protein
MAMTQHEVARTLVKSAPELWEVCSDPDSLSRHLHAFGEIRITRVEPETTVAWEGERASGTVRIEPAGWGTRVILTATAAAEPVGEPEVALEPGAREPVALEPVALEPGATEPAVEDPRKDEPVVDEPAPAADPQLESDSQLESDPQLEPDPQLKPDPRLEPDPQLETQPESKATPRPGFFRRLGGLLFRSFVTPVELHEEAFGPPQAAQPALPEAEPDPDPAPVAAAAPELEPEPESELTPAAVTAPVEPGRSEPEFDPGTVLAGVLDRLGSDHHRPFSRG